MTINLGISTINVLVWSINQLFDNANPAIIGQCNMANKIIYVIKISFIYYESFFIIAKVYFVKIVMKMVLCSIKNRKRLRSVTDALPPLSLHLTSC